MSEIRSAPRETHIQPRDLMPALSTRSGWLVALPSGCEPSTGNVRAALATLGLELWHWQTGKKSDEAPSRATCKAGFQQASLLLASTSMDELARQAITCHLSALAAGHGLHCWAIPRDNQHNISTSPSASSLSPLAGAEASHDDIAAQPQFLATFATDLLPQMSPSACARWLMQHGLTYGVLHRPATTIFGRLGAQLAGERLWASLQHLKPLHVAFIHGYGGSVHGQKSRYLQRFCADHGLPYMALSREAEGRPAESLAGYRKQLQVWRQQPLLVVGSSLGGYFARQLAHELGCASLLINPSVLPQITLRDRLPEAACRRYAAYPMRATPDMHLMLARDDEMLDHSLTEVVLKGADMHWYDGEGHRWRNNALIGEFILRLNARRQRK